MQTDSSNIRRVWWKRGGHLFIEFKDGGCYIYFHFPKQLFVQMCLNELHHVERVGQFFQREIRNKYRYQRLPAGRVQ